MRKGSCAPYLCLRQQTHITLSHRLCDRWSVTTKDSQTSCRAPQTQTPTQASPALLRPQCGLLSSLSWKPVWPCPPRRCSSSPCVQASLIRCAGRAPCSLPLQPGRGDFGPLLRSARQGRDKAKRDSMPELRRCTFRKLEDCKSAGSCSQPPLSALATLSRRCASLMLSARAWGHIEAVRGGQAADVTVDAGPLAVHIPGR